MRIDELGMHTIKISKPGIDGKTSLNKISKSIKQGLF